jgi:ABC-type oligopeptide transport system substrate-binding subunit
MLAGGTALLISAGLAQSAGGAGEAAEARKGGTLRVSTFVDVDYVDPALAYIAFAWPIGFATCAKLFNYPDASGAAGTRLVPEVVKAFNVSRDGRTYTFELRRTFRFHTGAAVTARSFADAFNRVANPRLRSPATTYMREIVGALAVMEGKARAISGVRVLGRYRLRIRLTRPVGDFTARLTLPFFCPILPNTPVDPAGMDNPPGSGPYYVAERVVNRRIVLKRNPHYRGGRPAHVDQVVWTISASQEACLLATEQDRIDHCLNNARPLTATHRRLADQFGINRPGGQFFVSPSLTTWFVAFNHDRRAFSGPGQIPLKKAINYAIDRPEAARAAFGYLGARRTDQLLPPALGRNERIYPLAGADPATARTWYARARVKPRTLVLYAPNREFGVAVAQVLVFNLKQIGIELDVKYYEIPTLLEKAGTRGEPFDLAFYAWAVDYADAAGFYEQLLDPELSATGNLNLSYFSDPRVSARMKAANSLTGEARRKAWADLDVDLMRNDPPWAPIVHLTNRSFVSRSLGCFLQHPVYGFDLAAVCKK